jgi:hypothetical protein
MAVFSCDPRFFWCSHATTGRGMSFRPTGKSVNVGPTRRNPYGYRPDAKQLAARMFINFRTALGAISACWELYSNSDEAGQLAALAAVRALLPALQPQCRPFARELIAFSLDWSDRERLWPQVEPGDLRQRQ